MKYVVIAFFSLVIGVILGLGTVSFLGTPLGKNAVLIGLAVLGTGGVMSALIAVFSKVWVTQRISFWKKSSGDKLYKDAVSAAKDPHRLPELISENREGVAEIFKLVVGIAVSNRSIAYTAMALGGIVSVATLFTAYTQIERMEQQNALIKTQNALAEASRRASLNFELTAILDQFALLQSNPKKENLDGQQKLIVARSAAISRSLKPYKTLETDGTLSPLTSPERTQLFFSIQASGIPLQDFIEAGTTFAYSDLNGIDFKEDNLDKIDLKNSNLTNATMNLTSLTDADLRGALLPSHKDFAPRGNPKLKLDGAMVPEPDWQLRVMQSEFGSGEKQKFPKIGKHSYLFTVVSDDNEIKRTSVNHYDLRYWLRYEQIENKLVVRSDNYHAGGIAYRLLRQSREPCRGNVYKYGCQTRYLKRLDLDKIIQKNSKDLDHLKKYLLTSSAYRIADGTVVYGHPVRTQVFEVFRRYSLELPDGADLRGISPRKVKGIFSGEGRPRASNWSKIFGKNAKVLNFAYADLSQLRFVNPILVNWQNVELSYSRLPRLSPDASVGIENARLLDSHFTQWRGWGNVKPVFSNTKVRDTCAEKSSDTTVLRHCTWLLSSKPKLDSNHGD